jgi:hypothetical protein
MYKFRKGVSHVLLILLFSSCLNNEEESTVPVNVDLKKEGVSFTRSEDSLITYLGVEYSRRQIIVEKQVIDSIYLGQKGDTIYALAGRYLDKNCLQPIIFGILPQSSNDTTYLEVQDSGCGEEIPPLYFDQFFDTWCWLDEDAKIIVKHLFHIKPWHTHADPEREPKQTIEYEIMKDGRVRKTLKSQLGDSTKNLIWYLPYRQKRR